MEDHPWPKVEWFDFSVMEEQFRRSEGYAVMSAPTVYCSPGVLTVVQDLFGMEKTLIDMYATPELWHATAEKIMEFNRAFLKAYLDAAAGRMDFYRIGEDYGTQRGLLFGPDHYREFLKARNVELTSLAKTHGCHYYQRTCGSVRELIPDLIEAGVEVFDAIQVLADGMEPEALKRDFGDALCFSGGVDEQELLPNGTPAEVRDGVFRLLDVMAPKGGFFLGSTHNSQEDIPTDNIVAMYEAGKEYFGS